MKLYEVKKLTLKELQNIYCNYLTTQNLSLNTIKTSCNDAFYLYKKDNTIDFGELLMSPNFEEIAYDHLNLTLNKYSNGNIN
jgi:hypothetical protein|nr:MAG TPA: hypothetical protein [Caudoviricetes sp.]